MRRTTTPFNISFTQSRLDSHWVIGPIDARAGRRQIIKFNEPATYPTWVKCLTQKSIDEMKCVGVNYLLQFLTRCIAVAAVAAAAAATTTTVAAMSPNNNPTIQ